MGWPIPQPEKQFRDNLNQARMQGAELTRSARAIQKNYLKIAVHAGKVEEAVLGQRIKPPPGANSPLHEISAHLNQVGAAISRAHRDMSAAEIKAHHRYINAILPLIKQNAEHAAELAKCWTQMHESLQKIANMFR